MINAISIDLDTKNLGSEHVNKSGKTKFSIPTVKATKGAVRSSM